MSISSQFRSVKQRSWVIFGVVAFSLLAVGLMLPLVKPASNCGGNSAALAACRGYIAVLGVWEADHKGQSFHLDRADAQTKRQLGHLTGASWVRSARLLACVDGARVGPAAEKRILMVCDQPYDNVPRRIFRRSPLAHAVAYSTGEVGLISPEQFARLDLRAFVDLNDLPDQPKAERAHDP